jgi:hypothetical protein
MANPAHRSAAILTAAGALLLLLGVGGVMAGTLFADRLYALLPPEVTVDAAAVGGGTVALGVGVGVLGAIHLALGLALWRAVVAASVPAIVLSAAMAVIALGWAAAALVSAVSGTGLPAAMLPAGIGLLLVAAAYGWAASVLIGLRRSMPPG